MEGNVNVVYGVSHVEGINDILEDKGWSYVNSSPLKIYGIKKERGEVKRTALPRLQVLTEVGFWPVMIFGLYIGVGGWDYAGFYEDLWTGDWESVLGYGVRHGGMYYGLGKIIDYG